MKIILIPSLNNALLHNLPGNVFGKRDFFLSLRHIQCRLFLPIAFLHTQKDTIDHDWTSIQASKYWYMAVDILLARWLIPKRTSLTADNATTIIQEGRIYHRKRKLPLINACRWEQLQCGSKAIPTRGSISCENSGNLCGRHEFTLTQCLHEKSSRKEIDVPCRPCQIAQKHFGLTKKNYKEPPVTFKGLNW